MPSRKVVVGSILAFTAIALGVGLAAGGVFSKDERRNSSTFESAPSDPSSPSVSPAPTLRPSRMPAGPPTLAPSGRPTRSPMPTETLSQAPTISFAPTLRPTLSPTPKPTIPQLPNNYNFRLKLYWREGYYWQEETIEREWCLECVLCPELTDSGFGKEVGCKKKDNDKCERGDQFWLQKCDSGNARFEIMSRDNVPGDFIQVLGTNLCLERKGGRFVALETCNRNETLQRWLNFLPNEQPFSWEPFGQKGIGCVSNHHHPKLEEVISVHDCAISHYWDTGFWNTY